MTTRLVGDELDLDLATLASALLIIIIVVLGNATTRPLDTAVLSTAVAIADGVGVVEVAGGGLIVLVCDVGHFFYVQEVILGCYTTTKEDMRRRYHEEKAKKVVEMLD